MSHYDELLRFVRAHARDPLNLAKIINGWEWTSLAGGSYGPVPTSAKSVPEVLAASCGWREILMADLFKHIGIQSRAVNFYNVPFQGNHTAIEVLIGSKWVFFDPTFGVYFERPGGGKPLSAAEARAAWPNVIVKKSNLEGWQGKFVDLGTINPAAYSTYKDDFFYRPMAATSVPGALSGEIKSLYFGPDTAYYREGKYSGLPDTDQTWKSRVDKANKYPWMRQVDTFDASGKLDTRWIEYDKTSKHVYAVFVDWDQANQHNWTSKATYVGNTRNAVFDYTVIVNDDKSKTIIDYDTAPYAYDWSEKTTHYTAGGRIDWQTGIFDDGRRWTTDWDEANLVRWKFYQDIYDSNGNVETTTFSNDDGTVEVVDWKHAHGQDGTSSGETLTGTAERDFLRSFGGNDILIDGGGFDRLEGGAGNDIYYVSFIEDLVIENPNQGTDTVRSDGSYRLGPNFENLTLLSGTYGTGNAENNFIAGNNGPNILSGLSGNDHLSGLSGNDVLAGGPGNDVLEGGPGADILSGNAGADVFIWRNLSDLGQLTVTADVVKDFSRRDGDVLNLAQIDANTNAPGNQAFTFIGQGAFTHPGQISYIHSGGETRILLNTDSDKDAEAVIRLPGLKVPDASWFIL